MRKLTVISLVLLLWSLGSLVFGLSDTNPGLQSTPLLVSAMAAACLGWLLARSPLPGWLAASLVALLGLESTLIRVGRLGDELGAAFGSVIRLGGEIWRWPLGEPINWGGVPPRWSELGAGAARLLGQVGRWALALGRGEPVYDPQASTIFWHLLLWALAFWAAWALFRSFQPLAGLAPAGVVLGATLSYNRAHPGALYMLMLSALPLLALVNHNGRLKNWTRSRIGIPEDIHLDISVAIVGITIALMSISLLAPSFSIHQVVSYARQLFRKQAEQSDLIAISLGVDRGSAPFEGLGPRGTASLPRSHLIGAGPELSEQVVMTVRTDPAPANLAARSYWRSLTYDQYTWRGWLTRETRIVRYRGNQAVLQQVPFPHQIVEQEFQLTDEAGALLYAAGSLLAVDRDYQVAWRLRPDPESGQMGDLMGASVGSRFYRVETWLPRTSRDQLEQAGDDYPDWIREQYLSLPTSIPTRVISLTLDLTGEAATPYDKAATIESYLRTYSYTLDLPQPPPDRDVVDYFLFDLKKGYCDYFATSMVVMARAAGLPARLVVGYASGTWDEAESQFLVTAADAHSWAELYFPGYGWIEFEPTAGRPPLERPDAIPPPELPPGWAQDHGSWRFQTRLAQATRFWWLGLILPVLLGMLGLQIDRWRLHRLSPAAAGITLYRRLGRQGQRLGIRPDAQLTPYELSTLLTEHLAEMAQGRRWSAALIPSISEIRWLTHLYVSIVYSPHAPDPLSRSQAIRTWGRLRRRLLLARLWVRGQSQRKLP